MDICEQAKFLIFLIISIYIVSFIRSIIFHDTS